MSTMLGLRANWKQFTLLVIVNAFVGGMVGMNAASEPSGPRSRKQGNAQRLADPTVHVVHLGEPPYISFNPVGRGNDHLIEPLMHEPSIQRPHRP